MKINHMKQLVTAAICLALCMLLPFLTGQIPEIGNLLSPMHIPVFICGFLCGWPYALIVGFIAPILRFLIFGMPPLMPIGLAMAFEMAAYGVAASVLYRKLPQSAISTYISLIGAMLIGRIVWGLAAWALYSIQGSVFTFNMFLASAFIKAVPGIICHILLIPPLIIALKRAGVIRILTERNA